MIMNVIMTRTKNMTTFTYMDVIEQGIKKKSLLNCQVYREAICHPCRINEGEEFTISWADGGPEVQTMKLNLYI